ncbi:MAG TPA: methyltransferase domain-containing protein [Phycisphaerae bacterium]|nr:methyltransferase domain-containing protein [Phycisphaerae bacterium]
MNPHLTDLPIVPVLEGRRDVVVDLCRSHRVLHVGCVDAGHLHERFRRGELLHQQLASVAMDLWGVDIDPEGISFLRSVGFANLFVGDACRLGDLQELHARHFGVIVACEVIEHLQNPGQFLVSVKRLMDPGGTRLVVSVPCAFRMSTLAWLLRGKEYVHPEHLYYFSYRTLTNLLTQNGLQVDRMYCYSYQYGDVAPQRLRVPHSESPAGPDGRRVHRDGRSPASGALRRAYVSLRRFPSRLIASLLFRTSSFWGDGIIAVASVPGNAGEGQTTMTGGAGVRQAIDAESDSMFSWPGCGRSHVP